MPFASNDFIISWSEVSLAPVDPDVTMESDVTPKDCGTTHNAGAFSTFSTFTFTVAEAGTYQVQCVFSHFFSTTNAVNARALFRLTGDGGTSNSLVSGFNDNGGGGSINAVNSCYLNVVATLSAGSNTINLQETTNLTSGSIDANTIDAIQWYAYRIGD